MDNNNISQPGAESLNERLRRAAEMARKNIAQEEHSTTRPPQPRQPEPQPTPQPTPQPQPRPTQAGPQAPAQQPTPPQQPKAPGQSYFSGNAPEPVRHRPEPVRAAAAAPQKKKRPTLLIVLGALLAVAIVAVVIIMSRSHSEIEAQKQQIEQLQLQNEQIQLANEYESLNNEYAQYENQTALLANDSIVQKYAAARSQVEKLLNELKNEKNKSAAQISKLKNEIATLKSILRTYVEQINELQKENQSLRTENEEVKNRNAQLNQTVQSVQANNQILSERMTLAEKLNVTGVSLTPLNKKGKKEKNVTKATQLMVSFSIPQNNSTPVGEKTIYMRITSPEGELLGNAGTFSFEGSQLRATARKNVEYAGEEIGGIHIYWDVNATLNPGEYLVELFTDGYRLSSRRFTLKK